jgi:hypothetical protein
MGTDGTSYGFVREFDSQGLRNDQFESPPARPRPAGFFFVQLLFVAQGDHRVYAHSAARGDIAGK